MQGNRDVLKTFTAAWVGRDVAAMLALVTDDVVYAASVGPEPGQTWRGKDTVQAGIAAMLAYDAGAVMRAGDVYFFEDKAFAQWSYQGAQLEIGCDLFTFRDGLIARKEAYRKCRR